MRTLLEILLLASEEHQYFATEEQLPFSSLYMCIAAKQASKKNKITDEELDKVTFSIGVLLRRLTAEKLNITFSDVQNYNCFISVAEVLNLNSFEDKEKIKKWWLNVFSNLEIDGGELVFSDEEKTYYAKKFDYLGIKMRSLNNLFEIVTSYHRYWTGDEYDAFYMCNAVEKSYYDGLITAVEAIRMKHKIIIWMKQEWKRTRIKKILKGKLRYIFNDGMPDRLFEVLQLNPIIDEAEIREWWEKKFKTLD